MLSLGECGGLGFIELWYVGHVFFGGAAEEFLVPCEHVPPEIIDCAVQDL